jgi:5-methylcytosine-specific restriction endonuclease McrA
LGVVCDSTITLAKVFRRDIGVCQICKAWVKPRHASLDHIKPVSKGGTHTWDNIQLVHLVCNLRKGDRE